MINSNVPFNTIAQDVLAQAEKAAEKGASFEETLAVMRGLSFEDFGLFLFNCPNPAYPNLSRVMPDMASPDVQKGWTGITGMDLFKQSAFFMRMIESIYARYRSASFTGKNILDFGSGYSRFIRLFYYFTDPANIWGIDPWDRSLNISKEDGVKANFVLSDTVPKTLDAPDGSFDFMFAYSVFTHLSLESAHACLDALLPKMKKDGLLVVTIRPIEFWKFIDQMRKTNVAEKCEAQHKKDGYAYFTSGGAIGEHFGDTSMPLSFFETTKWKLLGVDRVHSDPYQITCVLEPRNR